MVSEMTLKEEREKRILTNYLLSEDTVSHLRPDYWSGMRAMVQIRCGDPRCNGISNSIIVPSILGLDMTEEINGICQKCQRPLRAQILIVHR